MATLQQAAESLNLGWFPRRDPNRRSGRHDRQNSHVRQKAGRSCLRPRLRYHLAERGGGSNPIPTTGATSALGVARLKGLQSTKAALKCPEGPSSSAPAATTGVIRAPGTVLGGKPPSLVDRFSGSYELACLFKVGRGLLRPEGRRSQSPTPCQWCIPHSLQHLRSCLLSSRRYSPRGAVLIAATGVIPAVGWQSEVAFRSSRIGRHFPKEATTRLCRLHKPTIFTD